MSRLQRAHAKRLVVLLWLFVAVFYFYLSYDYIRVAMNDDKFGEYLQYVVQLAGNQNRTPREVRQLILDRASEYELPIRSDQVTIQGSGRTLSIAVSYEMGIQVPILRRGLYSKHFSHKVSYNPNY